MTSKKAFSSFAAGALLTLLLGIGSSCVSRKAPMRAYILPSYAGAPPAAWLTVSMPGYLDSRNIVQAALPTGELQSRRNALWAVPLNAMVASILSAQLSDLGPRTDFGGRWRQVRVEIHHFAPTPAGKFLGDGVIAVGKSGVARQFSFEIAPDAPVRDHDPSVQVALYDRAVAMLAQQIRDAMTLSGSSGG